MGRLVPWCSWEEWEEVAKRLLSERPDAVADGIAQVNLWRFRGRVPVGAEATAALLEVSLQDIEWYRTAGTGNVTEHSLRLAYAMAIVRFVNGVADSGQKSAPMTSVASLARQYGLPRVLVDIRHDSTHNKLPSLPMLRLATQHALSWLRYNYWFAQRQVLAETSERILTVLRSVRDAFASEEAAGEGRDAAGEDDGRDPVGAEAASPPPLRRKLRAVTAELKDLVPAAAARALREAVLQVLREAEAADAPEACGALPGRQAMAATRAAAWLGRDWPALPGIVLAELTRDGSAAIGEERWADARRSAALAGALLREAFPTPDAPEPQGPRAEPIPAAWVCPILCGVAEAGREPVRADRESDASIMSFHHPGGVRWEALEEWLGVAKAAAARVEPAPKRRKLLRLAQLTQDMGKPANRTWAAGGGQSVEEAAASLEALQQAKRARLSAAPASDVWRPAPRWAPCPLGCAPTADNPAGSVPGITRPNGAGAAAGGDGLRAPQGAAEGAFLPEGGSDGRPCPAPAEDEEEHARAHEEAAAADVAEAPGCCPSVARRVAERGAAAIAEAVDVL
mmetsp:Transcript_9999/g.23848  ORF Transcript_9999/g.23848 Transcript_9999/m.23848 type:complete len:569 (+) Transcript_9999:116-1822(+)